ncbi:MAG: efflux RND transporter permease subunit [Leptospiraceae bacterium]|nr:efflux RND transporter permease subunit [Leptospiraceae bacterium]MCP5511037.1 efflux RND transporter permease subunit [Leptospiraceae bacterium]
MKHIVRFFVERPMWANLFIFFVFGIGILSVSKMRKEAFPEVNLGQIIITSIYPGASAADVEINVTVPIEDAIKEQEGIKEFTSYSREGISIVSITADEDLPAESFQKLRRDIDNSISNISNLPKELKGKPIVDELTSSDLPILELAFSGPYEELKDFVPELQDELTMLEGVSRVKSVGLGDEEVHILVDPEKAKEKYVDFLMISQAIRKRNLGGSGGTLKSFLSEKKIVSYEKYEKPENILDTIIRMSPDGYGVKLREVAKLEYHPEDLKLKVRNNGSSGASLLIIKKSNADIVKTLDGVSEFLDKKNLPPNVSLKKLNDGSKLTRNRIGLVMGNSAIGFILVVIVLFLTFDIQTAIWTAFGIPFSLLGGMIILYMNGQSLNMFVLGGFILVVGMLVDDAIVISDTIKSLLEKGYDSVEAASRAVEMVWAPVLASSATTMAAFSPLISLGGLPGKFIWVIPLIVILSLIVSLVESYFILPVHLAHVKGHRTQKKVFIEKLENKYESFLGIVLKHKPVFFFSVFIVFFITIIITKNFIKKDPFPQEGSEGFIINVLLPKGSSLEKTESIVKEIDSVIQKIPSEELDGFSSRIGTNSESVQTEMGSLPNTAVIFVYLHSFENRKRTAEEIRKSIALEIENLPISKELTSFSSHIIRFGPPLGRPFEVRIIHNDSIKRKKKAEEIKEYLKSLEGVYDVDDDEIEGKDELNLQIDHDLLASTGLTVEDVLNTIGFSFEGRVVTDLVTVDKKIDFRMRLNEKSRADLDFLRDIPILNRMGQEINLSPIIKINESGSTDEFKHYNGKRYMAVFGNLDKDKMTPESILNLLKEKYSSEREVRLEYSGEPIENKKIFSNLGIAALFAIVSVYLIIALIFNSYLKPVLVLSAIPLGLIGVMLSIFIHGMALSMFVGIALIGLMGVIVNNSIVMIYTSTDDPEQKITDEVIIQGAKGRLRPILLTTTTTILGLFPTAYGIGGYDPVLSPMSLALMYGLLFGTLVVLLFIPSVHSLMKGALNK